MPVIEMLEGLGEYYMVFIREDGYEDMLRCLGDSLQEWISNMNNLHVYLDNTLGASRRAGVPLFW